MIAAARSSELRALVLRGLAWKAASQLFLQGSRVAVAVVLARLLAPHDFGLAAMVLVFLSCVPLPAAAAAVGLFSRFSHNSQVRQKIPLLRHLGNVVGGIIEADCC